MKNIKKITSLLLSAIFFFTFCTMTSFAHDGDDYGSIYTGVKYDGIYYLNNQDYQEEKNVVVRVQNNILKLEYSVNGTVVIKETTNYCVNLNEYFPILLTGKTEDNYYIQVRLFEYKDANGNKTRNDDMEIFGGADFWNRDLTIYSDYNKLSPPIEPQEIETSFGQKVVTDSGQYEMYISGFLNATVVDGANALTSADIVKQNISIHVKNTVTGEIRIMTQSTIEGMTLNASGGTVTSITLKGRVQTPKGTFERYITTVNI